jgi:hypothetical protein
MATRSTISMELPDGTVRSIYCHWDGYPSNNGKILLNHYSNREKISKLLDLGSLSCLGDEIGEQHNFDKHSDNEESRNWCLAYGRDRGENDVESKVTTKELIADSQEYNYLYTLGDEWIVSYGEGWKLLEEVKDLD